MSKMPRSASSSRSPLSSGIPPAARSPSPLPQQPGKATAAPWSPDRGVRFLDGSLLQRYLAEKVPYLVSTQRRTYRLRQVLFALKEAILEGALFDPRNPSIVMCDANLEKVLGARALHTTEIRNRVRAHLEEVSAGELFNDDEEVATTTATTALAPNPDPAPMKHSPALLGGRTSIHGIAEADGSSTSAAGLTVRDSFDFGSRYSVTPAFLEVIRTVGDVSQQTVFSYKELTSYLSKYILANKDRLFDARNHMVVICKGDALGEAFGVDAFHRTQVSCLLTQQLLKAPPQMDDAAASAGKSRKRQPLPDDDDGGGGSAGAAEPPLDAAAGATKKPRRRSGFSVTIEVGYSSDGGEGAGEGDDRDSDDRGEAAAGAAAGDKTSSEDDLQVFAFEGVYSEEFEPSDSDDAVDGNKADDSTSSDVSDLEATVLVASVVFSNETDLAEWADSSDSNDSDSDFALANYDPETESETWRCVNCFAPNTPYIRYCCRCWRERKGWVPDRPKPRRRKRKDKKTEGLPVKKSAAAVREGKSTASPPSLERQRSTSDSGIGSQASQELSANGSSDEDGVAGGGAGDRDRGAPSRSDEFGRQSMTCTFCCVRPKDATFVHGRISHQVCCYKCAIKLFKKRGSCPVCRRKIEKITKNIVA